MRWVDAMQAVIDTLLADATLSAISGFRVFRHGEATAPQVPGIAWMVFSDLIEENTNPIRVQFDVFARGIDQALTIEGRLRAILHRDLPQALGGVLMWTQLLDARGHADPEPGVIHRSLDFNLEPAREALT